MNKDATAWSEWIIGLLILLAIFIVFSNSNSKWQLMICNETLNNNTECYTNSYIVEGYKDKKSCMEAGLYYTSSNFGVFECGNNCKLKQGFYICKEICNKTGCHK